MPSTDHPEGLRTIEVACRWQLGDGLLASVDQVGVLFTFERERPHAEHAIFTLQLNGDTCGDKVRYEGGDADAEIDVEPILQLCRGTACHLISRPRHVLLLFFNCHDCAP